ncbi:MAG: tetratricopeptide repeat protein [Bacteroidota bacterium]|nr:tetratricopeptide repeat protein [Bacteroidota bacterium]
MKKKFIYILLIAFFFSVSAFVVIRYSINQTKLKNATYPLLERKDLKAIAVEWQGTKETAQKLINTLQYNPKDVKAAIALSSLYIQEARITGNYVYYDAAALKYINSVLEDQPDNFEALTLKSLLYMSQHHFADGLAIAEKAQKINPYNALIYGILVDGNVEMGNYKAAVENSDKMVSIRPDIRSYSRISYLREIHGDYPGAIEAMKLAVEAGGTGDEPTEWTRIQLARLYENTGDVKSAEMHYLIALQERPDYPYATAGLGHLAMVNKDFAKAISYYEKAAAAVTDYAIGEQLSQLYRLNGNQKKADDLLQTIIDGMNNDGKKGDRDESIGHYADRELAYAYLLQNNYDDALKHALIEYGRRPENIDVNQTVAWVYYKKGDFQKAKEYIDTALKTNCKNPTLLCQAGLIYVKSANKEKAKEILTEALKNNPAIDIQLKTESENALKGL